jgi:hypothetical protein
MFQWLREFREWQECRARVLFATREDEDRKAMAGLVGTPG